MQCKIIFQNWIFCNPVLKWLFVNLFALLSYYFLFIKIFEKLILSKSLLIFKYFGIDSLKKKIIFSYFTNKKKKERVNGCRYRGSIHREERLRRAPAKLLRLSTRLSKAPTNTSQACNSCDEAARLRRHSATKIPPRFKNGRRAAAADSEALIGLLSLLRLAQFSSRP